MASGALADDPAVVLRGLTRAQYDVLVAAGELEGQHVELLEGMLVEMPPQGPMHADAVGRLSETLTIGLHSAHQRKYQVRGQTPLAASDSSEPEPDLAIIDRSASRPTDHPTTAHLVIEIAKSSHRIDLRHKPRIYAGANVPEYWVVDLVANEVVVHRDPEPGVGYRSIERLPLDTELEILGLRLRISDVLG